MKIDVMSNYAKTTPEARENLINSKVFFEENIENAIWNELCRFERIGSKEFENFERIYETDETLREIMADHAFEIVLYIRDYLRTGERNE